MLLGLTFTKIKKMIFLVWEVLMVVDVNTGKIGTSGVVPAQLAFIQSGDENYTTTTINQGIAMVVPWNVSDETAPAGGDVVTNNVVNFNAAENAFILRSDAAIEVSAMVGYIGGGVGGDIVINATLQLKKAGETSWKDYSSVRGVYSGSVNYYRNTLNIPPAMINAHEGDAIRLIVVRPPDEGTSGYLGSNHLVGNGKGIVRPFGTEFSKSLKILVTGGGS